MNAKFGLLLCFLNQNTFSAVYSVILGSVAVFIDYVKNKKTQNPEISGVLEVASQIWCRSAFGRT